MMALCTIHLAVALCTIHLAVALCTIHLAVALCTIHLAVALCTIHLAVALCTIHLAVALCTIHLAVALCTIHLVVALCTIHLAVALCTIHLAVALCTIHLAVAIHHSPMFMFTALPRTTQLPPPAQEEVVIPVLSALLAALLVQTPFLPHTSPCYLPLSPFSGPSSPVFVSRCAPPTHPQKVRPPGGHTGAQRTADGAAGPFSPSSLYPPAASPQVPPFPPLLPFPHHPGSPTSWSHRSGSRWWSGSSSLMAEGQQY
ncbi:unnamed protein product [Closterium sp. NIES-54]